MTKFVIIPSQDTLGNISFQKKLIGKMCVTTETLARRATRSKYTGAILRQIRADGFHR